MRQAGYNAVMKVAGLQKDAAQRATKILRQLVGKGDVGGANKMIRSMSARGHAPREHVKTLGAGAEGVADLVASPRGLEVEKLYNPHSPLVSPEMLRRKEEFFQGAQQQLPGVMPEYRGRRMVQGPDMAAPAHRFEYVPGRTLKTELSEARQAGNTERVKALREQGMQTQQKLEHAGENIGLLPRDIFGHGENVMVTPQGKMRPIDVMPLKPSETGPAQFEQANIPMTPGAVQTLFTGYGPGPKTPGTAIRAVKKPGELKAMIHRGEEAGLQQAGKRVSGDIRKRMKGMYRKGGLEAFGPRPTAAPAASEWDWS